MYEYTVDHFGSTKLIGLSLDNVRNWVNSMLS